MFADDTSLFTNGTKVHSIQDTINKELSDIPAWLRINGLSLDVKKNMLRC